MIPKRNRLILLAFLIIVLILSFLSSIIAFYTDWLFFAETDFLPVLKTTLAARIGAGLCFGLLFLVFALVNLHFAYREGNSSNVIVPEGENVYRLEPELHSRLSKPVGIAATILLALLAAVWGASQWENLLLFYNRITVGTADPVLGKDLGFYFFDLPLMQEVNAYVSLAVPVTALMVIAVYYVKGGITLAQHWAIIDDSLRKHLAVLGAIYALSVAFGFYLHSFELLIVAGSSFHGAGYTDIHARLPALRLLAILSPIAGVIFAVGVWKERWRLALAPLVVMVAIYGIALFIYPALLQKFKVAPNELDLEAPYIQNSIRFTRLGFDLEKIETVPFDVDLKLTSQDIADNEATIKNIRLWDTEPLLKTFSQLQQIRTYYKFSDVDNDRYLVDGQYTQVMLSPRELSYADLPSRNWINERLIFTHGNGLTMGPVSRISAEGLPEFILKDIPPVSLADIKVTRPELYYSELPNDYVVVRTKIPEFSYPTSAGNINTTYSGKGGVTISSLGRKALFAARFRSEKILLSSDITAASRILYYRNVTDRVSALAPFLRFDTDPYLVVNNDGRLTWMIDAYTSSERLPYSKTMKGGISYMRNSVKATVDAYDGTVTFYLVDPGDVLARVYSRIYPTLFKPISAMPQDLRSHVRYPHQFLLLQAAVFAAYHMTDPKVFYNRENLWEIPVLGDKPMEPYYTIMKLPGEESEEYILLLPFTPSKRDNLAAWLTARCDGANYGKILAYTFPRDRLIYGPKQIDARINQDAFISQQLTLWNQRGSEVIHGSMLVIPIERSLLYVQPLYLVAERGGLPELRRVIVAYGDQVVMEPTLELALQRIFTGKRERKARAEEAAPVAGSEEVAPAALPTQVTAPQRSQLAREALGIYERAIELQRRGDWAGYGEELQKLQQVLKQLAK
jgi:uncharacterized protein